MLCSWTRLKARVRNSWYSAMTLGTRNGSVDEIADQCSRTSSSVNSSGVDWYPSPRPTNAVPMRAELVVKKDPDSAQSSWTSQQAPGATSDALRSIGGLTTLVDTWPRVRPPGSRPLTLMPEPDASTAMFLVKPANADFAVSYAAISGMPKTTPLVEHTFRIRPYPCFSM